MAETEHIFLHTGLPPDEAARRLADALGARLARHEDGESAVRRAARADPRRTIGGEVVENEYGEDDAAPGDEAVYDRYDTVFEVWLSGPADESLLHAEAVRLFDEIVAALPWPAVHTHVGGLLYAASAPGRGRTDFPAGTSYAAPDAAAWHDYAHPDVEG